MVIPGKVSQTDNNYVTFLADIKRQLQDSRKTIDMLNQDLLRLYWRLGQQLSEAQERFGWDDSFLEQLSQDLLTEFYNHSSFSVRNLLSIRQFFQEYRDYDGHDLLTSVPWRHNLLILNKLKSPDEREFYLRGTREHGWNRTALLQQIKHDAHGNGFTGSEEEREHHQETVQDTHMLDFLGLTQPVVEQVVEHQMAHRIRDLLLQRKFGFCFIGEKYQIHLAENEYFIDLLFYHRRLKSLVAVELKTGAYRPEYEEKLAFSLSMLDDYVRGEGEGASVGLLICIERDRVDVRYALAALYPEDIEKHLSDTLPVELREVLPTASELQEPILKSLDAALDDLDP